MSQLPKCDCQQCRKTRERTWLSDIAGLYAHDIEGVETWLTTKHPQLKLQNSTNLDITLSPLEAVCYGQEEDVAKIVDQLVSGAYV